MNRYPITSARIRPLERPVSPFLSDVDRDQLRADYLGPQYTAEQYAENQARLRGQEIADQYRGKYRTYNDLEKALNPQFKFAEVGGAGDPAVAAQLRAQGYLAVEGMDGEGNGRAQWVAPDQIAAYREYQAQQQARNILGNEFGQQRAANKNAEYQQRQVDLRQANQLYGGLAEAGVSFAPGSLNRADVREDIWNSRGNIPGLVSRQSNDAEGYLRSPLSRSPFSMRWNPQQEYDVPGDGMVDPRAPRYQGATAGPGGVVNERQTSPYLPDREENDYAINRRLGPSPTASLSSFRSRLRPRY